MISILGLLGCRTETRVSEEKNGSGTTLVYKPKNAPYSASEIRIIPLRPETGLTRETAISLITFLSKEFPNKEIRVHMDTAISFVDGGENFEKVVCPGCGKEIPMESWQESMAKASMAKFRDLSVITSCCNKKTDLNSLKYQMDCGFAKTILTVNDPAAGFDDAKLMAGLKNICGIDFKIIYAKI